MKPQVFFHKLYHMRTQLKYPAYLHNQAQGYSLVYNSRPNTTINTSYDNVAIPIRTLLQLTMFVLWKRLAFPPSFWAGLVAPTPRLPMIHWRGMCTPQRASHRSPAGCWGTSLSGLSLSVIRDPPCRVLTPSWPMPVRSPWHPRWWVSLWWDRVSTAPAAPCEGTQCPGMSAGRMWLALGIRNFSFSRKGWNSRRNFL